MPVGLQDAVVGHPTDPFERTAGGSVPASARVIGGVRLARLLPMVMVLAAFGPYVYGGVRTEQLVGYALIAPALLGLLRSPAPSRLPVVMGLWGAVAVVASVAAVFPPNLGGTPWIGGSLLAGLDNFLLPLAVMLAVWSFVRTPAEARAALEGVCVTLVVCMSANTVAALLQTQGVQWSAWWSGDGSGVVTALLAEENGRYSGLINQPAEAGFLYSLAIVAALRRYAQRPSALTAALAVLSVGGALTVSKTFLLVGLPLLVVGLFERSGSRGRRLVTVLGSSLAVMVLFGRSLAASYPGFKQLAFLTNPSDNQSLLSVITAQRYGRGASSGALVTETLHHQPLFGYGAGGLGVPLDSTYVAILVYAGLTGLVLLVLAFAFMAREWATAERGDVRHFFGVFLVLLLASNLGIPTLTANRAGTVAWVFLSVTLLAVRGRAQRLARPPHEPHDGLASIGAGTSLTA